MEKGLTVLFPGFGYGSDKPLLHYAGKCAAACGYDRISVNYRWLDADSEHSLKERTENSLEGAVLDALRTIREAGEYRKMIFVSKSFGTFVAGETEKLLKDSGISIYQVYLTPLPQTYERYMRGEKCLAVTGSADPLMTAESREWMRLDPKVDLMVMENGNHSLENPQDPLESIQILETVTRKILSVFTLTEEKNQKTEKEYRGNDLCSM